MFKILFPVTLLSLVFLFLLQNQQAHEKEITIQNPWFVFSWNQEGKIRITDHERNEILSASQYLAEYGEIYNALSPSLPKGSASITLDKTPELPVGSWIELRSESYAGRLNKPLIHQAKVNELRGNEVLFTPSIPSVLDRNIFMKQEQTRVRMWERQQIQSQQTHTGWIVTVTGHTPVTVVTTQYQIDQHSPELKVHVKTKYKQDVKVFREALALYFKPNVTEVYRKNRIVDTRGFQSHYWLDREGVRFGTGQQSALLYHPSKVSSLELNTGKKELIVNLDHMGDHHYVQQTTSNQVGKVRHPSEYRTNDERVNSFSLVVGYQPKVMARFMSQPYGYLATHVWTEHADEQTLESNRAIYFGSEKITQASQAVGGFVKYRIPVTKSVFYSNPYYKPYIRSHIAIEQQPQFLSFLDELHKQGNEIVLHTLYPFEFRHYQKTTENILAFMKNRFGSVTWIDHGYLKSSFAFDALDKKTPHYMAQMWEKYDTKYFWHYSAEDTANTNVSLDLYQTHKNDSLRTPLYWSHPTVTGPFYTWAAAVVPEDTMYQYSGKNLYELIHNRGVFINHTYLARVPSSERAGRFMIRNANGEWVIHPALDQLLKKLSTLRDQGDLYLTTVRDIMNYWIAVSQVRIEYAPSGAIWLHNQSNQKISGLSMATQSNEVFVNGKKPLQREVDGERIFWFDLEPGARAVISSNPADH